MTADRPDDAPDPGTPGALVWRVVREFDHEPVIELGESLHPYPTGACLSVVGESLIQMGTKLLMESQSADADWLREIFRQNRLDDPVVRRLAEQRAATHDQAN